MSEQLITSWWVAHETQQPTRYTYSCRYDGVIIDPDIHVLNSAREKAQRYDEDDRHI